jgi:hypothetical protein
MELPAGKYRLQNNIVLIINDEGNDICVCLVPEDEDHLLRMSGILKDIQILLVKNDLSDILKRYTSGVLESLVLLFIPENIHGSIYGNKHTLSKHGTST